MKRIINKEDYLMVKDWSGYKNTHSKILCICEGCGCDVYKTIHNLDTEKSSYCKKCSSIKRKRTCQKRYGVECNLQDKNCKDKIKQTNLKKYGVNNVSSTKEVREKVRKTCLMKYNVESNCQTVQCINSNKKRISKINIKWKKGIEKLGYEVGTEFTINNLSFDLHIINTNILIEINPTYTHNSTKGASFGKIITKPKDKEYHKRKTQIALNNGYKLINIWDWVDKEYVFELIKDGFEQMEREIQKHWYNIKTKECIINDSDIDGELMIKNGFLEVYDDGFKIKRNLFDIRKMMCYLAHHFIFKTIDY